VSSSSGIPGPSSSTTISIACDARRSLDCSRFPILDGVVEQITNRSLQGSRLAFVEDGLRRAHTDRKPGTAHLVDDALHDSGEINLFTEPARAFIAGAMPFMYHCHVLEHEDHGMMGQFAVV